MWKKFDRALGVVVGLTLALVACQPPEETQPEATEGEAQVVVRGLSVHNISRMVVTAQPANVSRTLDYNPDTGLFSGRMVLPAGEQTLTAEGYSSSVGADGGVSDGGWVDAGTSDGGWVDGGVSDGGSWDAGSSVDAGPLPSDGGSSAAEVLVATGSATVTIVAGSSTSVTLRIYDVTPTPPQGDIGPLIRSVTASKTEATVGGPIVFTVDAVDLDGDPLSYMWSSSCMSGTFSSPWSASTSWSSSSVGVCRVSVTVSSRSQSATESLEVTIFSAPVDGGPGEGSVLVNGEYVARPNAYGIYISGPGIPGLSVYRGNASATLPNAQAGQRYSIDVWLDFGSRFGTFATTLENDCGGTVTKSWDSCSGGNYCSASYSWIAPAAGTACKLTARASNGSLTDSFSVGLAVR